MSWAASFSGPAGNFTGLQLTSPTDPAQLDDRSVAQLDAANEAVTAALKADESAHVSVNVSGHANAAGEPGSTLYVSVSSVVPPADPPQAAEEEPPPGH